jgi:stress response protein SCP2
MSDAELYINAIIHYWTLSRPSFETKIEPLPLVGNIEALKVLELGNEDQFQNLFKLMMNSKSSLTKTQIEELKWFLESRSFDIINTLPDKFNHQEVMAIVVTKMIELKCFAIDSNFARKYFNSATSILRVIVAMNKGDVSLASNVVFPKLTNFQKASICNVLETIDNLDVDMLRHANKWKLLFKLMRAKQFSTKKYPKLCAAVSVVRGHSKAVTFNSTTEMYFAEQQKNLLINHLTTRPSMFARQLDRILKVFDDHDFILYSFRRIVDECSSLVLLQLIGFYRSRNSNPKRVFMPKGDKAKGYVTDNNLQELDAKTCARIIAICFDGLEDIYRQKLELGNVYIDPVMAKYTIPLQLRSASKSFKTVGRGTRFAIDSDFIRLFVNWVNIDEDTRTDLDLSGFLLDEDFGEIDSIAYYNLSNSKLQCNHSGDIVDAPAPDGACEFIDIDINSMLANSVRYVVMCVHNYTNQPFAKFDTAFAGWMSRDNLISGEVFEPRTVSHRYDLTSDSQYSLPVVFDLVNKEAIWLDLSIESNPRFVNNLESNKFNTSTIVQAIVKRQFPNMMDLLKSHANARGTLVYELDEADTVFDLSDDSLLRPWELEKILGEYL